MGSLPSGCGDQNGHFCNGLVPRPGIAQLADPIGDGISDAILVDQRVHHSAERSTNSPASGSSTFVHDLA